MATLTEVLGANNAAPIENNSGNALQGIQQGLQTGMQLATAKEQVEGKKAELENQKADLVMKQASTANSLLTNLARANPAIAKKMLPKVREKLLNLGVDPEVADYTVSDDANRKRQIAFANMAGGSLTQDKAMAADYFQSLADVIGYDQAAQKFDLELKREQEDKKSAQQNQQFYANLQNQKDIAGIKKGPVGGAPALTVGDKARDTKFAKEYTEFFDSGGASRIESNLKLLEPALSTLEKGETTKAEGFVPDAVGNVIFPDTANVRSNITSVLIQSLKDTFGGQLSDGERKAMVESVYIPSASPQQNAVRVRGLIEKIQAGARAKEAAGQYFETNGTLKGFKGTENVVMDLKGGGSKKPAVNADIEKKRQAAIAAGYSPAEVDAYIQNLQTKTAGK